MQADGVNKVADGLPGKREVLWSNPSTVTNIYVDLLFIL
jgi:hypothetical protein